MTYKNGCLMESHRLLVTDQESNGIIMAPCNEKWKQKNNTLAVKQLNKGKEKLGCGGVGKGK